MNIKFMLLATTMFINLAAQASAYDPDRRDRTLFDKNQYQHDWYYQDKWRYARDPYLSGENQPLPPQYQQQDQDYWSYEYQGRSNYSNRPQVIHGQDLIPAWNYRDNWRYNRAAYLSGNNRPYHYPDIEEYQEYNRPYYNYQYASQQYYGQPYNYQYQNGYSNQPYYGQNYTNGSYYGQNNNQGYYGQYTGSQYVNNNAQQSAPSYGSTQGNVADNNSFPPAAPAYK